MTESLSMSTNYRIFKRLRFKLRHFGKKESFVLLYSFLYKFSSDLLKNYLLVVIEDEELTLDEAYQIPDYQSIFREDSLHMFGYYIEKPEAFMDEVISGDFSISEFFNVFSSNTVFSDDGNYAKYFQFLFECVQDEITDMVFDERDEEILKDIILAISKLDINDEKFHFEDVFDVALKSSRRRLINNSQYMDYIFSAIVSSQKSSSENVYIPFCDDGSGIVNLIHNLNLKHAYVNESDRFNYCFLLVKIFLNYFNLDNVFLQNSNEDDPIGFEDVLFDSVVCRIPKGKTEAKKIKNSKADIQNVPQFLAEKSKLSDDFKTDFPEEYESLNRNEFLFLINLINRLKDDGIMVISISQNFLFKNSLTLLRKYLTYENNFIDAVIRLPNEFERNISPEVVVVFKRNKTDDNVLFIDLSADYSTKKAESIVPGLFKRNLVLDDGTMAKLMDVYMNKRICDKFSNLISIDEIKNNDFNLSVFRYVDTFDGEFFNLKELKKEKEEIDLKIKDLNEKIDKMMDDLNIHF